ncbi:Gx transporter family protein [Desulfopila sp. IMCC35008]|uniref:Gx transporter family protein n=1 Tax=Desulfopila sp. IMCC35008 TaxID=2653858 RepID=UPI0013D594DD|nr:Gx transporter family protein [Desulfopila sp. IMCC35008]
MSSATERDERIFILAAFALFLAGVEYMIPKPLPFMRLGLANLPILISLALFSPRQVLLLTLYKVIGQGLLQGTIFSYIFLFSAAGSFAGSLAMLVIYQFLGRWTGLIGISVCGAFAGNMVRLYLARYVLFGEQVWIMAPPFLIMGLLSSLALGALAALFVEKSKWCSPIPEPGS